MNANVIEVKPFNITKIELVALRGPKGETGYPTPEQVQTAIDAWLEDHPEATTTVQDGAITTVKLQNNAVTEDKLSESLQSLLITDTANGSIASFSDGSDGINVRDLRVDIEPVQSGSGDPSPSNIRPITGWENVKVTRTGKNLFSGTINQYNANNILTTGTFLKAGTYKISVNWSGTLDGLYIRSQGTLSAPIYVTVYNSNTATLTLANDATVYVQGLKNSGINAENVTIQIETGSTATAYEQYQGTTITISLGSTVYGGSLDVTTGVLTVDRVKLSTSQIVGGSGAAWNDTKKFYSIYPTTNLAPNANAGVVNSADAISNIFDCSLSWNQMSTGNSYPGKCGVYKNEAWNYTRIYLYIPDTSITTKAQAEAWLTTNGVEVSYKLATPTTVQLTAQQMTTLLGQNNIFADAGDVDVTYVADTKLYIAKMIANALNA